MLYELKEIIRQFGSRTVLDIRYLSIEARKIYGLVGPNGAGKTTLLNQLAFLDQPSSGELRFRNTQVHRGRNEMSCLRRQVVLVDQSPILFSGSVWSNVEFGLKVRGVAAKQRALKIEGALERVGMSNFARADAHGLSGGEVKRVALARALAVEPEVLLCDEPTANVDQENQEIILKILSHANSVRHTTVIFSTHYLAQSRRIADQMIQLHNGRLTDDMGENIFNGRVTYDESGGSIFKLTESLCLPLDNSERGATETVLLRIDPECLELDMKRDRRDYQTPVIMGRTKSVTFEHNRIRVIVDAGVNLHVLMPVKQYRDNPPLVGEPVNVVVPRQALRVIC